MTRGTLINIILVQFLWLWIKWKIKVVDGDVQYFVTRLNAFDQYVLMCIIYHFQGLTGEGSAIDLDMGPSIDASASKNYRTIKEVLERLTKLCVQSTPVGNKPRKHEQRLLRNMGAHSVVLELLQIPYEKVWPFSVYGISKLYPK